MYKATRFEVVEFTQESLSDPSTSLVLQAYGTGYTKSALSLFSSFMLAAANKMGDIGGDTTCDEIVRNGRWGRLQKPEHGVPVSYLKPRLQNTVVNNIIIAVQQRCRWEGPEAQLVILCALSIHRKLQRHTVIE